MKSIDYSSIYSGARTFPAAVFLATMALASPAGAAPENAGQVFTPASVLILADATEGKESKVDRVEERIKDLHARLNITQAQEQKWGEVTKVMRENAQKMDELTNARDSGTEKMSAVDNLKSYGEIAGLHEDGIKNFIPVFAILYDSMSDGQKKDADMIFRNYGQKAAEKSSVK